MRAARSRFPSKRGQDMTVLATEALTTEQMVKTAREQLDAFNAFKASHQVDLMTLLKFAAEPK